jgi:hypothetical protein
MRRVLSYTLALIVPALLTAGSLVGAPKKDDKDGNSEKMIAAGQVVGKITNVYEGQKKLRIQIAMMVPKFNQGAANALAQAQLQYQQAISKRPVDVNGANNAQLQMARQQAMLYTYERKTQDIDIQTTEDVVVRSQNPPEQFDDKGKLKQYTKKELAELRGDNKKLPGYKAEFSDLQTDFIVQVQLVKKKDAPKPMPKPKDKDKDADLNVLADNEPLASMIVIVLNPNANPPGAKMPK